MSMRALLVAALIVTLASSAEARAQDKVNELIGRTVNRAHGYGQDNGRPIVQLDARPGDGMAIVET